MKKIKKGKGKVVTLPRSLFSGVEEGYRSLRSLGKCKESWKRWGRKKSQRVEDLCGVVCNIKNRKGRDKVS